jgi:hypothetical protein
VDGLDEDALAWARASGGVRRTTAVRGARYTLELPPEAAPDAVLAGLVARGATLVSLNPLRDTLEDYFVRLIAEARAAAGESA